MSQRERWVVYPLLFFCVMMSIQAQGCPPGKESVAATSLTCEDLTILDSQGATAVKLGTSKRGVGYVKVYGFSNTGNPKKSNPSDVAGVMLSVDHHGGIVETSSRAGGALFRTAQNRDGSGRLMVFDEKGNPMFVPALGIDQLKPVKPEISEEDPSGEVPPVGGENPPVSEDENDNPDERTETEQPEANSSDGESETEPTEE